MKIESLTEEQKSLIPVYRDEWLKIGLSAGETNKEKAEAAIKLAYASAGLPSPTLFIWTESPLHNGIAYSLLKDKKGMASVGASVRDSVGASVRASVGDSVRDSVWDSVRASVWASVRDSVGDSVRASVWDSVRASVGDSVWDSVRDSVWASVRDSVRDSVRASVGDSVGASVRDSVWDSVWASVGDSVRASVWDSVRASVGASVGDSVGDSVYGSYEAPWLAFYQYFHDVCGIDCSKLDGLWECAKEVGWFIPMQNGVIISPKPKIIKTAANSRGVQVLHADGEPALYYCDDFKIYAHDGVRLPEKYGAIPVSKWNPEWILEESNADIRTVLIKGIGYERYLEAVGAQVVDKAEIFDLPYELLEYQDKHLGRVVFLKMKNPSVPGVYHVEPVAPRQWIKTCEDALRWRQIGDQAKDKTIKIQYQFIK